MKALLLLSLFAAVVTAVPHKNSPSLKEIQNGVVSRDQYYADWFDCRNVNETHHPNPNDCTRYIHCDNKKAWDRPCPDCDQHNRNCRGEEYLFWDSRITNCNFPAFTNCSVPTPTTTQAPSTGPTEEPGNGGGGEENEACPGWKAGEECAENNCRHCGYCKDKMSYYFRCNRTIPEDPKLPVIGVIVHENCGPKLWWNPDQKPENAAEGGSCDYWENLSSEVKHGYLKDPNCVENDPLCEWGQDKNQTCSPNYWYFNPEWMKEGEKEDLSCNGDLIWDQKTETCREQENVDGC